MDLIADVGGTRTRCALVGDDGLPLKIQIYANSEFESLTAALSAYLQSNDVRAAAAAIAVAAPITGDSVRMTNRQWHFSIEEMRQDLGLEQLQIINDFTAVALSIPALKADDVLVIGSGHAIPGKTIAVLGPGTGLGVSGLIPGRRGWAGSGTIFFSLCNLQCVFCQNWDISQRSSGEELPPDRIAEIMIRLQEQGCHNINFVTPEHVVPQLLEAIAVAIPQGLRLPIVYNTSAYDSVESLKLFDGIVDIYMPDFKFWERATAKRLAKAPDYPARARDAIREMHRQVGPLRFAPNGLARRGVLVRHLVMPGQTEEAAAIFRWLAKELSPDTYVNIMGQYHPEFQVGQASTTGGAKYSEINRRPTQDEIGCVRRAARDAGLWRLDERL